MVQGSNVGPRRSRMPVRRRLAALVSVALGTGLLAACGGAATGSGGTAAQDPSSGPGAQIGTRVDQPMASALMQLPLRDAHGNPVQLKQFRGKVLVVSDAMTLCQETCPLDTATVVQTARDVEKAGLGDKVEFLSITVDPRRDTTTQLAAYRKLFPHAPKNWTLLTGSPKVLNRWWDTLGVWRQKTPESKIHEPGPAPRNWRTGQKLTYDVAHSDEVFFFDGRQHERFVLEGPPHVTDPSLLPKRLRSFLNDAGRKNLAHPSKEAWTEPQALKVVSWLTGHHLS
ncbi:MAG TPA: SCO family protein [Segeticoccus sp.]|uniref:SCO family protein n=1 Tax=Segeticoccus sp. TaxID=2706531 RepID=UPI002D7FD015|nr:SCO family protein [Segeticoccus sp.]HET8599158.1 SCO family protein [Segeticoccus sp.]